MLQQEPARLQDREASSHGPGVSTTNTTTPVMPPPRAHLLSLPAELLNYIVTLAVVDRSKIVTAKVQMRREDGRKQTRASPTAPALACTCNFLKALVMPIYYGQKKFYFASSDEAVRWLTLKLERKEEAVVRDIIVSVSYGCRVNISLNNTNEVAVRVTGDDCWGYALYDDWRRSLETRVSNWVEEIDNGRLYARKPSDKIPDFCLYLSLHSADKDKGGCGLSCVDEGIRLWWFHY